MIKQYDAAIIGGDVRQIYLAYFLQKAGYQVVLYGIHAKVCNVPLNYTSSVYEAMLTSSYILTPIPMSRDKIHITSIEKEIKITVDELCNYLKPEHFLIGGNIMEPAMQHCIALGIPFCDLMKKPDIVLKNAIATAEGTIAEAVRRSSGNLHQSKALVLGYGKCAKVLAAKLKALDVQVTIAARKKSDLADAYTFGYQSLDINHLENKIGEFDYIFNTVPALIVTEKLLKQVSCDTTMIDIASAPGGFDYDAAKQLELEPYLYLGIPGKIAPKASAEILAEEIISIMKERSE
jgi:Glutamyl-tRNA reductase